MTDPTAAFYETLADDFEDANTEAWLVKLGRTNRDIIAAIIALAKKGETK